MEGESESAPLLELQQKSSAKGNQAVSIVASSASGQLPAPPAPVGATPAEQLPAAPGTVWGVTACLLLADMLGIGSLSLPSVFARLGWVPSFLFLALFSVGCGYLGVLFSKLGEAVPAANAFDEIGSAALGELGCKLCYSIVYTTILLDPVMLQLTCVLSLQRVVPTLSGLAAGLLVAALMVPLAQIQSIHDIGFVSIFATGSMLFAIGIAVLKLLSMEGSRLDQTSLFPPPTTTWISGLTALMNLTFAFGGQVNWMRYQSAMKRPGEFKYAVEVADLCMTVVYILLATLGYAKLGTDFDFSAPVTSVLPRDAWVVIMNLALFFRCVVAYILNINVFTDMVIRVGRPWVGRLEGLHPRHGQKLMWGAVSVAGIAFSFLVAFGVPFFSTTLAFIASFGDVAAPYTLPALFGLALLKDLPPWERWLLRTLVPVSALFALAGVVAALAEVVTKLGGSRA